QNQLFSSISHILLPPRLILFLRCPPVLLLSFIIKAEDFTMLLFTQKENAGFTAFSFCFVSFLSLSCTAGFRGCGHPFLRTPGILPASFPPLLKTGLQSS